MSAPTSTDLHALSARIKALAVEVDALAVNMDTRSAAIEAIAPRPAPDQRRAVEVLAEMDRALDRIAQTLEGWRA